jgi:type VI secretion system secreted protein VgrG
MTGYTQVRQAMRVHTALDDDILLLEGMAGEEAVSKPYLFELDLVSLDRDIDGEQLLRTPMHVEMDLPDGSTRSIHGIVRRFVQRGRDEDLVSYRAEIVPWLWFLSLAQDCRIFQNLGVLEIVEQVFKGQGYSDFENRCTRTYPEREYCVQYRESDLNFVSRLLEEEGIFYFFEHQDSKHVLVLADDMSAIRECAGQPSARMHSQPVPEEDVVLSLAREHSVHTGKVTFGDYDYLQPALTLRSTIAGGEPEEVYDYPGSFSDLDRGEDRARLALEREEAARHVVRGTATCRAFRTGTRFRLQEHFGDGGNQTYAILELRHHGRNGSYRGAAGGGGAEYRNELIGIPHSVPYRPPLRARKPTVHGAQTAEVVGPGGEEIYVDEHGRVKVHFHWDRQGGRDDNSSCWVRVSQNWAGKNWGGMFIPHIGQEVIVDFLEGDADRPIITGRVYNAKNAPPEALPANKHKSIIQDDYGNELVFDATPGDEHIRLYSPSHDSMLEIGRSIKWRSDDPFASMTIGSKAEFGLGMSLGLSVGFKTSLDMGGSVSLFAGVKASFSLSDSVSVTLGDSAKVSHGKEYKWGLSEINQHSKGQGVLRSDYQVFLAGGGNSLMNATKSKLLLQYGDAKPGQTAPDQAPKARGIAAQVAAEAGGLATVLAAAEISARYSGHKESYLTLLAAVPKFVPDIARAVAVAKAAQAKTPGRLKPGDVHSAAHTVVELKKKELSLVANEGSALKSRISLFGQGTLGGMIQLQAKKGVHVKAEADNTTLESRDKNVVIKAGQGVDLRGQTLKLKGTKIDIG